MTRLQQRRAGLPAVYSEPLPTDCQETNWSFYLSRLKISCHDCWRNVVEWSYHISYCLVVSVVVLFILSGAILLCVWLGFEATVNFPNMYINRASLTLLSAVPGNNGQYILDYNLTTEISLRNRQRFYSACYHSIMATAFYDRWILGSEWIDGFCQGHKSTITVPVVFAGKKSMVLSPSGFGFLKVGNYSGSLPVDLTFEAKISVKWGSSKSKWKSTNDPLYKCFLTVPTGNGTLQGSRSYPSGTKCNYHLKDPNVS